MLFHSLLFSATCFFPYSFLVNPGVQCTTLTQCTSLLDARAPLCAFFENFCQVKLFGQSAQVDEVATQLAQLRQGGCSVIEFAIEFKTLAASCDWNEGSCRDVLCVRLEKEIQDQK